MRALAMTGMVTVALMPSIISGSLIRATPPSARMSAGTRSRAMTATAPASSATFACSGVTTSMMTPPFSISAKPRFTGTVPVRAAAGVVSSAMDVILRPTTHRRMGPFSPTRTRPSAEVDLRHARFGQLDPAAAGSDEDRLPVRVREQRRLRRLRPRPVAEDDLATGEDDGIAPPQRRGLGRAGVGRAAGVRDELEHDVVGGHRLA